MNWKKCDFGQTTTFAEYTRSLSAPIDSFLEDHILKSQFYQVRNGKVDVGHFAIHGDGLLTQFYLCKPFRHRSADLFAEIRQSLPITEAFAPTADNFFLSQVIDTDASFTKQAIFWELAQSQDPSPISRRMEYRTATPEDAEIIQEISGDFLDRLEHRIGDGQIFVGFLAGRMVAVGIMERSHIWNKRASIGMFTQEAERGHGIGTATLQHLIHVCSDAEIQPIAGCYYYNEPSRRTLTAAGMVPAARLLRFRF